MAISKEVLEETVKGAKILCGYYMDANIPAYIHGAPGLGKSSIISQLAKERKIGFVDVRASTLLPEDISGIPVPDLAKKVAVWLKGEFWPNPDTDGSKGIILFDELSDASRNIQSALYRVILDRMHIPAGWWPCAAGNRREDRAAAQALSTALANRFAHIVVTEDVDAWIEWCNKHEHMGHLVPGFIRMRRNLLHNMPESGSALAFPTPRAWEQVAKIVNTPSDVQLRLISGLVGPGAAGEFHAYLKVINLPDLEDIIAAPKKCRIPKEPANKYALACMLSRAADKKNFAAIMTYCSREDYGRDFEVCTVLDTVRRDPALCETQPFVDFAERNAGVEI